MAVVTEILRAVQPESDFVVAAWATVLALKHVLRYGPLALAALVAIVAKSNSSRADRALEVLRVLRDRPLGEQATAPRSGSGNDRRGGAKY